MSPLINWSIHKSHIWVFLLNPEHHPGGNSPSGIFFLSPNLKSVSVWDQGVSEQMTSRRPTETDVQTLRACELNPVPSTGVESDWAIQREFLSRVGGRALPPALLY